MAGLGPEQRGSAEEGGADVNSAGQRLLQLTQGHTVAAVGDADPVLDIVVPDVLERCRESLFPEVLPQDAHPVNVRSTSAWDLLTWVHSTEHIRIAEYMNERYYIFRCHSGERSEGDVWLRAKWARTFFYVHLAEYLKSGRVKLLQITSVFAAEFSPDDIPVCHRSHVAKILDAVGDSQMQECTTFVVAHWKQLWNSLPSLSFGGKTEDDMKRKWLAQELPAVLQQYLDSHAYHQFHFEPELCIEDLPVGPSQEEARLLVAQVQQEQAVEIAVLVEKTYDAAMQSVPSYIRKGLQDQIRFNFLVENYYKLVRQVVGAGKDSNPALRPLPSTSEAAIDIESKQNYAEAMPDLHTTGLLDIQRLHVIRVNDVHEFVGAGSTSRIGKGHFGAVYLVASTPSTNKAACKIMPSRSPTGEQLGEMDLHSRISHAAILPVLSAYRDHTFSAIVLPLGQSDLMQYLTREGAPTHRDADRWARGLYDAMSYLHFRCIAHRDVKPENLILQNDSQLVLHAMLTDFGHSVISVTRTDGCSLLDGTPNYWAPEIFDVRAKKRSSYGYQVDIWATGVTVYAMYCAERPYPDVPKGSELPHRPEDLCLHEDREQWELLHECTRVAIRGCMLEEDHQRMSATEALAAAGYIDRDHDTPTPHMQLASRQHEAPSVSAFQSKKQDSSHPSKRRRRDEGSEHPQGMCPSSSTDVRHAVCVAAKTQTHDFLQDLYPHSRDANCMMDEASHTYFVHDMKYMYSVSNVWRVFFNDFDSERIAGRVLDKARDEGLRSLAASIYNIHMYITLSLRHEVDSEAYWSVVRQAVLQACRCNSWDLNAFSLDLIIQEIKVFIKSGSVKPSGTASCYFLALCAGCTSAEVKETWEINGNIEALKGTLLHKRIELYMQELAAVQVERNVKHIPLRELLSDEITVERVREASSIESAMRFVAHHTSASLWDHPATQSFLRCCLKEKRNAEFEQFEYWLHMNPMLSPFRSEWSIYDETSGVAGQIDSLWFDETMTSAVIMADWKRSKHVLSKDVGAQEMQAFGAKGRTHCISAPSISNPCAHMADCAYNHYLVQQHLYADFLRRHYNIDVRRMLLVQLHPHLGMRPSSMNEVDIPKEYDLARQVLHAFKNGWWSLHRIAD